MKILHSTLLLALSLQLHASASPKVVNNLGGTLDYHKKTLPMSVQVLQEKPDIIGQINKDGTLEFNDSKINVSERYIKLYGENPTPVATMFEMSDCKGKDPFAKDIQRAYLTRINNIDIRLYGQTVATLSAVAHKSVLKNPVQNNSYFLYFIDKDIHYKDTCEHRGYTLTLHADIQLKKGINLVEKRYEADNHVGYYLSDIKDPKIKWKMKRHASDEEILQLKKIMQLKPINPKQMEKNLPHTLGLLTLTQQTYGKVLPRSNNTHTLYAHYETPDTSNALELYISDIAKDSELIHMAKEMYSMEAAFGNGQAKPYISQTRKGKTKLIYIYNNRLVINAHSDSMDEKSIWNAIESIPLDKIIKE